MGNSTENFRSIKKLLDLLAHSIFLLSKHSIVVAYLIFLYNDKEGPKCPPRVLFQIWGLPGVLRYEKTFGGYFGPLNCLYRKEQVHYNGTTLTNYKYVVS